MHDDPDLAHEADLIYEYTVQIAEYTIQTALTEQQEQQKEVLKWI